MAQALEDLSIENAFYLDETEVLKELDSLDALIVVKRIDVSVVYMVSESFRRRKAVYFDVCDDFLAPGYKARPGPWQLALFGSIAPYLSGIITTGPAMVDRIQEYLDGYSTKSVPIHILKDIAETQETVRSVTEYFRNSSAAKVKQPPPKPGKAPPRPLPPAPQAQSQPPQPEARPSAAAKLKSFFFPSGKQKEKQPSTSAVAVKAAPVEAVAASGPTRKKVARKKILWFGNYGSNHGTFGIVSLLNAVPALRAVQKDIPLELVVVSNNRTVFDAVIGQLDVPSSYLEWSVEAMAEAMGQADVALLTNGDDRFSMVKSSNRALQALASGVPVVASSNGAMAELSDFVVLDDFEAGLRRYLGDAGEENSRHDLLKYEAVAAEYSAPVVAAKWRDILVADVLAKRELKPKTGATLFILREQSLGILSPDVLDRILAADEAAEFIVDSQVFQKAPALLDCFIRHRIIPSVVATSEMDKGVASRMAKVKLVVLPEEKSKLVKDFTKEGRREGVAVTTLKDYCAALGPFPERLNETGKTKWVFVTHQNTKGWILDAICREIGSRQPDSWHVAYNPPKLPDAENYFYSHYSLYLKHTRKNAKQIGSARNFVWYTHPREDSPEEIAELVEAFNKATRVIFACSQHLDLWLERGLKPEKGCVVLGGADPKLFQPHARMGKTVGISSSYYDRKNPDLLLELVRTQPGWSFILIGRNWEEYSGFEEMKNAPNFQYVTAPYADYPSWYARFDVLLSASTLEGGPIPLLEAMMANVVPVASRTGFAPDLIRHRENGYLFDIDANASDVATLIEAAFDLKTDVRETVVDYSWDNFAAKILGLAE